ncbi:MAG: hypothetical protein MOGMAGMI_00456 [Candidatus Omnitrophica bacterium]|nr:hypothetical protein [Candidatus Omnitrophota bacterium]
MKVLYLQYTSPRRYPPLLRSARIFRAKGCSVVFGVPSFVDPAENASLAAEADVDVRPLRAGRDSADKAGYVCFVARAEGLIRRERPDWVYLSDLYTTPAGLFAPRAVRLAYHEHDAYSTGEPSAWVRALLKARAALCRRADLVVVPNRERLRILQEETGADPAKCSCVWNCPSVTEVPASRPLAREVTGVLRIVYCGTIVPERVPEALLGALPENAWLDLVGYETIGSPGYARHLVSLGQALGAGRRVSWHEPVTRRKELSDYISGADAGLALLPAVTHDINLRHMLGASNKAFDYLACGVLPIVPDRPDWREVFVDPGYALAASVDGPAGLSGALAWIAAHRTEVSDRARAGQARILSDWNYEKQFAPVAARMIPGGSP